MKNNRPKAEENLNDVLNALAHKMTFLVHKADEKQEGPFKDDAEYSLYLFDIKRELFAFYEKVREGRV